MTEMMQSREWTQTSTIGHRHQPFTFVMAGLVPAIHVLGATEVGRGWPGQAHGCPVRFLWTRRMALILLCSKRLATFWDTEKDQAMLHHNSVFHGLLKHVPWDRFDRLVEEHGADARVRRLLKKRQVVSLLYGQLLGGAGFREIVNGVGGHAARLLPLGAEPVLRAT